MPNWLSGTYVRWGRAAGQCQIGIRTGCRPLARRTGCRPLSLTVAGRPPSSATGRADEDDDKVADKMGEEEDKEVSWKDSEPISSATSSSELKLPGADDSGLPAVVLYSYCQVPV